MSFHFTVPVMHRYHFNGHFPSKPRSAGFPLNFHFPMIPCLSIMDRPHSLYIRFAVSHQVFLGCPLCRVPSNSYIRELVEPVCIIFMHVQTTVICSQLASRLAQSQQFPNLHIFLVLQIKNAHQSKHTHLIPIQLCFMLLLH